MKKKLWFVLLGILLLAAGGLGAAWPFLGHRHVLRLPGIVEVQEVRLGSKVGGRVKELRVKEGDITKPGEVLVVFEAPELKNQWLQTKAKLDSAQAELLRAKNGPRQEDKDAARAAMESAKARYERTEYGWREEEKEQANADLKSALADYDQAAKEYGRILQLFREKSASQTDFDLALALRDRTKGRKDSAKAKVEMMAAGSRKEDKAEARADWLRAKAQSDLLENGTRPEDILIAAAKVVELQADLEAIDINLKETQIVVPEKLGKAVIEVIAVRPGDLVQPNQPVVRVLRVEDLWVKIFVPETQYGLVTLQKEVDVTIDSYPGRVFKGFVIQRANIAEFTPRNVQSVDERRHQVFAVKVHVPEAKGVLNAGMAAEVTIPLE